MKQLFPTSTSYSDVYWKTGLLTSRTILAHGIHLEDVELKMLKETGAQKSLVLKHKNMALAFASSPGAGISHCPNSNCSIRSGNMDVRRAVGAGVKVGLGTDCSAGYSPSMINSMRFVSMDRYIVPGNPNISSLSHCFLVVGSPSQCPTNCLLPPVIRRTSR